MRGTSLCFEGVTHHDVAFARRVERRVHRRSRGWWVGGGGRVTKPTTIRCQGHDHCGRRCRRALVFTVTRRQASGGTRREVEPSQTIRRRRGSNSRWIHRPVALAAFCAILRGVSARGRHRRWRHPFIHGHLGGAEEEDNNRLWGVFSARWCFLWCRCQHGAGEAHGTTTMRAPPSWRKRIRIRPGRTYQRKRRRYQGATCGRRRRNERRRRRRCCCL